MTKSEGMKLNVTGLAFLALASVLAADKAQAAPPYSTNYSNTASWSGSAFESFGVSGSGSEVLGQTFTAPAGVSANINSFSVYCTPGVSSGYGTIYLSGEIFAWNGGTAIGGPVYSGETTANSTKSGNGTYQTLTFNTGNLVLTPGSEYIALLTTLNSISLADNGNNYPQLWFASESSSGLSYGGGSLEYQNTTYYGALNNYTYVAGSASYSILDWNANFTVTAPVPEPATLALGGLGVLALGWARRKAGAK